MPKYLFQISTIILVLVLNFISINGEIIVGLNGQYQSIQKAIIQSPPNSIICIEPGIYKENIEINKPLTIIGLENDNNCILIISSSQSPAIRIASNDVIIRNIRIKNSNQSSIGIGILLDSARDCSITNNWVGYLGSFLHPFIIENNASENNIDSNQILGSYHTIGFSIKSSRMNSLSYNTMNLGWELYEFIDCDTMDNKLTENTLLNKWLGDRLQADTTTNAYSLKMKIIDSLGNRVERIINPSGWAPQGKLLYRQIWNISSHVSNTLVTRYWEIGYGGAYQPTYTIVKDSVSLNKLWSKFRISPIKPTIDFNKYKLVLIQPGQSITQYKYKINIFEKRNTINFDVQEYQTEKSNRSLLSQEAIIAYEIPQNRKNIIVKISRHKESKGPYPK